MTVPGWTAQLVENNDLAGIQDGDDHLQTQPNGTKTRAVYPREINYGLGGNKIQVLFILGSRDFGDGLMDRSSADLSSDIYQNFYVDNIEVRRLQQATGQPAVLRSYQMQVGYSIVLTSPTGSYRHLALQGIQPKGQGGVLLPATTFGYWQDGDPNLERYDKGHIWWVYNGYGAEVGYYYDAAGGDVHQSYRRVRARRVGNGLGAAPPHRVTYYYDYRGAAQNNKDLSAEANHLEPLHAERDEFRGFAWVRVQDPMNQVSDHYFSQDDVFKGTHWRVQSGKTISFTEGMNAPPLGNTNWTLAGAVERRADPIDANNWGWKLPQGSSIRRSASVGEGADVDVRLRIDNPEAMTTTAVLSSTWKIEAANGDYWGLEISHKSGAEQLIPRVVWSVAGQKGSRDVSRLGALRPRMAGELRPNEWHWLRLHTSPEGRFALELHRDDYPTSGRRTARFSGYVMVKSGDAADTGLVPAFPLGQSWSFKHEVGRDDGVFTVMDDAYAEARTVFNQADTIYGARTIPPAGKMENQPWAGLGNNADGMNIRFVAPSESWSTGYGIAYDGAGVARQGMAYPLKQTFEHDAFGNQNAMNHIGEVGWSGDDRSIRTEYVAISTTTSYQVGLPRRSETYGGIAGAAGAVLLARSNNYYDGSLDLYAAPTRGDLTRVEQVGVVSGADNGQRSVQQFGYDQYGNRTLVIDPRGNQVSTIYDPYYQSFPVEVRYANGRSETMSYDFSLDALKSSTDMNGTVTEHTHDAFGRPSTSWVVGFGSSAAPNEVYTFGDLGKSGVSAPFYISYEKRLGTQAGSNEKSWGTQWYDGIGRLVQEVTPRDATTSIVVNRTYTNTGQVDGVTLPYVVGHAISTTYTLPDTTRPKTTTYYDGIGRATMVVIPDGSKVSYDHNWLRWTLTMDESGAHQEWKTTDPLGRLHMVVNYDTSTNPMSELNVGYDYDLLDRLTLVARDPGRVWETKTTLEYDGLGRKSRMHDYDMGSWEYEYDEAGNLKVQRDALYLANPTANAEHQIFFEYDSMNRLTHKYYGRQHFDGRVADVRFHYDNDLQDASTKNSWGRLRHAEVTLQGQGTARANGHGYEYDARGLVLADVVTTTYTTRSYRAGYAHDTGGRLASVTYPDPAAERVDVRYNQMGTGLPQSLTSSITGNPQPVYNALYNERGQLLTLEQGSAGSNNLLTTNYTYDEASTKRGWLTRTLVTSNGGTSVHLDLNLGYTADGNISALKQLAGGTNSPVFTNTFGYDGFDRLRSATSSNSTIFPTEVYTFDERLSRMASRSIAGTSYSYTYGDPAHKDAPTAYRGNNYSYDAAGNQVTASGQTRTFDAENRLIRIVQGTTTSEFVYDANGKRVLKSVTTGTTTKRTLYVGSLYEEELTGTSTPPYINYYLLGSKPVGMRRANQPTMNGQYRMVSDHLRSANLLIDTSAPPAVVQRQYFRAYGEVAFSWSSAGSLTDIGYTGQRVEGSTGLMYYGARFYDPALAYFISPDSIVPDPYKAHDHNRYAYTRNNPLYYTDPSGNFPAIIVALGVIALVGLVSTGSTPQQITPEQDALGRFAFAVLVGDANDVVTVLTGNDYIADTPVPHFSAEWWATLAFAATPGVSGTAIKQAGRYLRHLDKNRFEQLLTLGKEQFATMENILRKEGSTAIIRTMRNRYGEQVVLAAGTKGWGLLHLLGRHLTGDIKGGYTSMFSPTLQVGDIVDIVVQTVQNGERLLVEVGDQRCWEYYWKHPTWGDIHVRTTLDGNVTTAFPVNSATPVHSR